MSGWAVPVLVLLVACGGPGGEGQRVERLRSHYQTKVTGWIVDPSPVPATAAPAEQAAAVPASVSATGESSGLVAAAEPMSDVHLDLEIRHDSTEKLPGLTVEVEQTDSLGREKAHYRLWLDTAAVESGTSTKGLHTLREIPHAVGDVFAASIRKDVPKAEWSLYKEFTVVP